MRKYFKLITLTLIVAIIAVLIYGYVTTSESDALKIAERYNAAQSFKWKIEEINSERGHWVVHLTPVEPVKEAEWLYINKWMGHIDNIVSTE